MTKFRPLAALFAIVAVVGVAPPAAAQSARAADAVLIGDTAAVRPLAGLHRTWSCLVPSGFVWSGVRSQPNCAGRYEYFLLDAVNVNLTGQWACAIPSGYSYSSSRQGVNCAASPGASPYEYLLVRV